MTAVLFHSIATNRPVFFAHKAQAAEKNQSDAMKITKYFQTDEELREWERLMREEVGLDVKAAEVIASGGCCCGTGGGMCDVD